LIDSTGKIRRTEFGEGNYDQTEQAIRTLLADTGKKITVAPSVIADTTPKAQVTPETYFGSNRSQYGYPQPSYPTGTFDIPLQKTVPVDHFALGGTWTVQPDDVQSAKGASITEHFAASNVYLILKPAASGASQVSVTYDGKPLTGALAGSDVINGVINVDSDRLYNIFSSGSTVSDGTLKFTFLNSGIQAFTFTFG
jgi:hypothetical protein